MRYIITGQYADGSEYGDTATSLAELAFIASDIYRFSTDETIAPYQRVVAETVVIETEEEL